VGQKRHAKSLSRKDKTYDPRKLITFYSPSRQGFGSVPAEQVNKVILDDHIVADTETLQL
jgi:hypothetical protein